MYDLYPDSWGPANHRPDNPHSRDNQRRAVQTEFDRRDERGQRPDDN